MKPLLSVEEMLHGHDVAFALLPKRYGGASARLLVALTCEIESARLDYWAPEDERLTFHGLSTQDMDYVWECLGFREKQVVTAAAGEPGSPFDAHWLAEFLVDYVDRHGVGGLGKVVVLGAVLARLIYDHRFGTIPSPVVLQPEIWVSQLSDAYRQVYRSDQSLLHDYRKLRKQGFDLAQWAREGGKP